MRQFVNIGTADAQALIVACGDGRKTPHFEPPTIAAAAAGTVLDADGRLANAAMLPQSMQG